MAERADLGFTGSLLWRGDIGSSAKANESRSYAGKNTGSLPFGTFCTAIEPYSTCNLTHKFLIRSYTHTAGAPGTGSNIDKKAVLYFRDPDTLEVLNFQYPDPTPTDIESTPWGKRVKGPVVVAIVALISTMAGVSYVPLYGVYYQRK